MTKRVIYATVDMDQEEAAQLLQRYEFIALPVVDENHRLCGVIQMDDVIDIIMHEASEDLAKMGGGGKDIDFDTKPLVAVKRRLPGSSCYYSSDSSQAALWTSSRIR